MRLRGTRNQGRGHVPCSLFLVPGWFQGGGAMPLRVDIVTAERVVYSEEGVDRVMVPGVVGELGVLPLHAPLMTMIQPGLLTAGPARPLSRTENGRIMRAEATGRTLVIEGGHALRGSVTVSGSKNATMGAMAAALLVPDDCILENVPDIED